MIWLPLMSIAGAQEVLPVRRVRFYETGVAWFERHGQVRATTTLPVPTSHLDDALKTLVVLGGDVDLGAITFPTALEQDAAKVGAGLEGDAVDYHDTLTALLGARVAIEVDGDELIGTLLDVGGPLTVHTPEQATQTTTVTPHYALTLLGDDGTLHRVTTEHLARLQATDPEVAAQLATAARALARNRAKRPNPMDVQLAKGGQLGLGYLAEAPVWRVSYRILDPEGGDAALQAWALVHNDTAEPWKGVHVELANGEPDSFLYPLAAPRYAERALKTPPRDLSTVAQLSTDTPDGMWNEASKSHGGLGIGGTGYGAGGSGSGSSFGRGSMGVRTAAALKTAEPVETPTQFVYRVARPVDLPPHHSALVPVIQEGIPTEAAVVFAPGSNQGRTGVWLRNATSKTLPAGVLSVVQSGGLAGESRLERLKPEETQMVTFGNELDVDLTRSTSTGAVVNDALTWDGTWLQVSTRTPTEHTLAVRNRSGRERALWIAMKLGPQDEVRSGQRTEIDRHTGWSWVVVDAPAGTNDRVVRTERAHWNTLDPADVAPDTWISWAEDGLADPQVLRGAATIARDLVRSRADLAALAAERDRAKHALEGLRTTLDAAGGSQPVARRAASLELELRRLDERRERLEADDRELKQVLKARLDPLLDGTSEAR